MKLIVGLGNPGQKYINTRHNIGYMIVDELKSKFEFDEFKEQSKFKSLIANGEIGNKKVLLAKPLTYMNLSGEAVLAIMQFYKINSKDLIVIYDELDFEFGKIRIKKKGTSGGHKGIQSIIDIIGKDDFTRIRIGIGNDYMPKDKSIFVLKAFNKDETDQLSDITEESVEIVTSVLEFGIEKTANKFH